MDKDKADAQFDLQRKYQDVYSPSYSTPEAHRYRIRKIIEERIKPWGKYKAKGKVDQDKHEDPKDILMKVLKQGG